MMGAAGVAITVVIWVVAIALLFYAVRQKRRGVLR
jgi:cbb3-type cytochrome oxidase subunit 3